MLRNRSLGRYATGRRIRRYPVYPGFLRRSRLGDNIPLPPIVTRLLAILTTFIAFIATLFLTIILVFFMIYSQIAATLKPRLIALQKNPHSFESSRIYDRNGTLLYEFFDSGRRTRIGLAQISPVLIDATIAIEDASFYDNTGVDYVGIARALYQNITSGEEQSGASTITQQLVKNVILSPEERSYENRYERKLKEIVFAQELNQVYSKEQILELYLNEVYYGNLSYGIESASQIYFQTHANNLTVAQASLLAGLPQLPSKYDPVNYLRNDEKGSYLPGVHLDDGWLDPTYQLPDNVPAPKWRHVMVLRQMVKEHYISEEQAKVVAAEDLLFAPQIVPIYAPHFVFYVQKMLEDRYGKQLVSEGGLRIYTTLDLKLQDMVQQKAAEHIKKIQSRNIHNASVVVMQPNTGQILAMVGSIDYNAVQATKTPGETGNVIDGQVNVAIRERQPGSSLKPFTYLAAMESGMTPGTIIMDAPARFRAGDGTWYEPRNYTGRWYGTVRIRGALANSLNMPAVKALDYAGVDHLIELLDRVGVKKGLKRGLEYYGLSLTLGGGEVSPLELTTAYNTLASGGRYFAPNPILKITNSSGTVLESFQYGQGQQVLDPDITSIVVDMMSDDYARAPIWGMGSRLKLSRPAAVKTGTSEDWRDAWTLGFSPFVTVGVWSGNNNNERTYWVESIEGGGVIWHNVMEEIFTWIDTRPEYRHLFSDPFPHKVLQEDFVLPDDGNIERRAVCGIGSFGGRGEELFTKKMLQEIDARKGWSGTVCDYYQDKKRGYVDWSVSYDQSYVPQPQPAQPAVQPVQLPQEWLAPAPQSELIQPDQPVPPPSEQSSPSQPEQPVSPPPNQSPEDPPPPLERLEKPKPW